MQNCTDELQSNKTHFSFVFKIYQNLGKTKPFVGGKVFWTGQVFIHRHNLGQLTVLFQ